ncbi:uncharacterized protein LOC104068683 [Cuculus canorus]|uniref:uncharacterized protein LOC104068683 n=1 Tax=Cuculus canorus TaxID=55661 RepID=UPI0023AA5B42|nr:uncharacterized protein LOC104068683 [Cuculus canorus]XP_053939662.1 uncharacterized protein LOC104068683 [Cuculus canorus]XP_053939663.1 uncharacterized protein LOC104068683 [Cuculus canorus]XP_053939664.1 uncharacterized protein LOC104068683 [Cuculus canorus]XP_053939665.1 uncharacterized protein LOC104068683 [Cuculus canorus]
MDPSHFTRFCFLLLTVAAPCPNIAMHNDNPAERTQDSAFGKTKVTVYHCKECERNTCTSSNYEDFVIIGETQNETFSNEKIQLVTSETHIIMCFQQENTIPKGIFAIFWEKDTGVGDSCDLLNFEASFENVTDPIIKTCCAAEMNLSVPNSTLKCYSEDEKTTKSAANSTDEEYLGIPQFSISKKRSVGIIALFVVLVVSAVAVTICCVQQKRKAQGPVIVLHSIVKEII